MIRKYQKGLVALALTSSHMGDFAFVCKSRILDLFAGAFGSSILPYGEKLYISFWELCDSSF